MAPSMGFLAPLFFGALATLAVPVLIHLIQREKKQVVRFPSLMFLEKIPYKSVQRGRIRPSFARVRAPRGRPGRAGDRRPGAPPAGGRAGNLDGGGDAVRAGAQ